MGSTTNLPAQANQNIIKNRALPPMFPITPKLKSKLMFNLLKYLKGIMPITANNVIQQMIR